MSYFVDGLNYSLSNEDTQIEFDLLESNKNNVFCIGGSGNRVLPLIAKNPSALSVVDLSDLQLRLVELRYRAAQALTHDEYLFLFGYRGGLPGGKIDGDDRMEIFNKISLRDETKSFWLSQQSAWTPRGFIYLGKWERHFLKISKIFNSFLRMPVDKIFEAQNLEDQRGLFEEHFKPLVFKSFLRVVASEFVFNNFLYKGHFSGAEGKRSDPRPPWLMVYEEFTRLFQTQLVRKNYFFQLLFLGEIRFEEGLPLGARAKTLEGIKSSQTQVNFHAMNLLQGLDLQSWDFVSLSDTISYLSSDEMKTMYQVLDRRCEPSCIAVIRSFLRSADMDVLPGWERLRDQEASAYGRDGTGVYQFQILRKS